MAADGKKTSVPQTDQTLPIAVQVQCDGFRCLAYRDKDGTWKDFHTGKTLTGNVRIIEYQGD
jgi:hypothetical protein